MLSRKIQRPQAPQQLPPPDTPPVDPPSEDWATLGPNAPSGLSSPFTDFIGDALPARASTFAGITPNAYGMGGTYSDTREVELVSDAASPSGQALRLNFPGVSSPRVGCAWPEPAYGGAGPSRFLLRSGLADSGRRWRRLYVHMWYRFSPNFSVASTLITSTTVASGTAIAGSTTTRLYAAGGSWGTDTHNGRFVRHGNRKGAVIVDSGNDGTGSWVDVSANDRFDYAPTDEGFTIYTVTPGANAENAGCKGWFWPQQQARMVGPVAGRGDGAALGTWNAPKDVTGAWPENHFHACWWGQALGVPGGLWEGFHNQLAQRWDAPYAEDANDLPIWSGDRYTQYPAPSALTYTAGNLVRAEYVMELNTPGQANGVWRAYHNGALVRERPDVMYTERYVSALAVENKGTTNRPVIGGSPRDVAYEITECWFGQLWHDMTFGGGLGVPQQDQWAQILAMAVSGAD